MLSQDFLYVRQFMEQKTGVTLGEDKEYLITSRLIPLAQKFSLASVQDVISQLKTNNTAIVREVINALSTHETFFFRDPQTFAFIEKTVLKNVLKRSSNSLKILSMACSTGQEAYSIALVLEENKFRLANMHIEIVATDISENVLVAAKEGIYSQIDIQRGVPAMMLAKYFQHISNNRWQINDTIKKYIQFKAANLLEENVSLGMFDIIFCRNVLIYFKEDVKDKVLSKLLRHLYQDGLLIFGGYETLIGLNSVGSLLHKIPNTRGIYGLRDCEKNQTLASIEA